MRYLFPALPDHNVIASSGRAGIRCPLDRPWKALPVDWLSDHLESRFPCDCYKRYGRGQAGRCYLTIEVPLCTLAFETCQGTKWFTLGQCSRCQTVYWTESPANTKPLEKNL